MLTTRFMFEVYHTMLALRTFKISSLIADQLIALISYPALMEDPRVLHLSDSLHPKPKKLLWNLLILNTWADISLLKKPSPEIALAKLKAKLMVRQLHASSEI